MSRTILQVPVNERLKTEASLAVQDMGFSSLQEAIRVFLFQLAKGSFNISIQPQTAINLSKEAVVRYDKLLKGIESGKEKINEYASIDQLLSEIK